MKFFEQHVQLEVDNAKGRHVMKLFTNLGSNIGWKNFKGEYMVKKNLLIKYLFMNNLEFRRKEQ
jgi:hypothetical protein